jgi:hypothetical protein
MKKNSLNLLLILPFLLAAGLTCSNFANNSKTNEKTANDAKPVSESKPPSSSKPAKLDGYTLRGFKFAYYKIPAGLKESELIEAAQKIHEQEPDAQLVLVDDDKELADYIKYAKAISGEGELDKPMPIEWADKHIIANVQKYTSGKFVLCKSYGSEEIADLK